jgi:acetoacetate decarboxylase
MLDLNPGRRIMPLGYDRPELTDVTGYARTSFVTIPFVTDPAALEPLLPSFFKPSHRGIVTVSYQHIGGVEYLAGRDYKIAQAMAEVIYEAAGRSITAVYPLAMWETDTNPIIAGREFLGTPKLYGEIPDIEQGPDAWRFSCSEYGALLFSGAVRDMKPLSGEKFTQMREAMGTLRALTWKYIPGPNGTVDANYPISYTQEVDFDELLMGTGEVEWASPTAEQAPISWRIPAVLSQLPVRRYLPAVGGSGPARLLRSTVERLPLP